MTTLEDTTWTEAELLAERVLVVPVGALEQHGPHLPLSTDTDIALELAARLSGALPDDVVTAPAVAFGSSGEHQAFAGTVSVGQTALEAFLLELGRSATCTWRRVLLISTHGGNAAAVRGAVERLREEQRDVQAWMPSWRGDAHAGRTETSLMLAIDAARVRLAAASAGSTEPLERLMPILRRDGVAAVSANGVIGDPSGASATEGEQLLAAAVRSLRTVLETWTSNATVDARPA